jgi:haloalkane dehalogenase
MNGKTFFTEHHVPREQGSVYVRDYKGAGPAFVLMHGFPDNLHIYDDLIPYLAASGRRVVAFDFLGFGASDKLSGATYSFKQQLGDLEAVVEALGLESIEPVAHDASGPAAINFTLAHPKRVASLCILNSAYDDTADVHWPEMIELFATKSFNALSGAIAQTPEQFGWLLDWQKKRFRDALPQGQQARFETVLGPLIADNFIRQPSSGPAFVQMASLFREELARNTTRLPELRQLELPVKVIWGEFDPYITLEVAKDRVSHFKHGSLSVLPAGHWLQSDLPEQVATEMLSTLPNLRAKPAA